MRKMLLICAVFVALFVGCNEYSTKNEVDITPLSLGLGGDEFNSEYVYNQYDTTVSGIIQLQKIKSEICVYDSASQVSNSTYFLSNAIFFDENENRLNAGYLSVNGFQYETLNGNFYHTDGNADVQNTFAINYGSTGNVFEKTATQDFPAFDTTFYFFDDINITSHSYNDTVDASNDLNITWSGTNPDNFVRVSITEHNFTDSTGYQIHSHSFFTYNDGYHTIPSSIISDFPNGMYNISIASYEPNYIKVENIPDVSVIAKCENIITIRFINN